MSAAQGRSGASHVGGGAVVGDDWEKKVVMTLMKVCLEGPQGQSSVDALRDALIAYFPSVLPSMKYKYGKFTAFLKAYSDYFQINPYDRTVRLTSIHPELQAPSRPHYDTSSRHAVAEHSHTQAYTHGQTHQAHNPTFNGSGYATSQEPVSRSSTSSTLSTASSTSTRSRSTHHATASIASASDVAASPRGYVPPMNARRQSTQSGSTSSSTASLPSSINSNLSGLSLGGVMGTSVAGTTSMPGSTANMPTHANQQPKSVPFSSLEAWEQMTVFAALKILLFAPTGIEHYLTLQEHLSDPQLFVKYSNICNLLCLFPGNFQIDNQGYVSLTDPAKARQQYPTLAAEFEKRMTAPPPIPADTTSPILIAIRNATSPWEKALLKTIWTTLMGQANHAANFPWLTTQLTRFKPHVKASYGSLRLWAIQQTLFKFQGDTIYIPVHVATAHTNSLNAAPTTSTAAVGATSAQPAASSNPNTMSGAAARNVISASGYASVNSANFSIPVPPALPQRRAANAHASHTAIPPPPPQAPPPAAKLPKSRTPAVPLHPEPIIYAVDDSSYRSRGRQMSSGGTGTGGAHKRQRSASPTSIRQMQGGGLGVPSSHNRSMSVAQTTDDIEGTMREPGEGLLLTRVDRAHMPKLQIPQLLSSMPPMSKDSHARKHTDAGGAPLAQHREAGIFRNHTHDGGATAPIGGSAATATSPRRAVPNPLQTLDKEIANLLQVPLNVNKTPVNIKPILNLDDLKRVVAFLSSCSSIAVSAELAEMEPLSARRRPTKTSTVGTPEDSLSPRSAGKRENMAYSAGTSPPGGSGGPLSSDSRPSGLVIGSAPSQFAASPLDTVGLGGANSSSSTLSDSAGYTRASSGHAQLAESDMVPLDESGSKKKKHRHRHSRSGSGDAAVLSSRQNSSSSTSGGYHHHLHVPGGGDSYSHTPSGRADLTSNGSHSNPKKTHHHRSSASHEELTMSSSREEIPSIIHEEREQEDYAHAVKDITVLCLTARTLHCNSNYAPSSTLHGHDDKSLFKLHPVFVLDLRDNPKFYRWLRPLFQSQNVTKVVYASPGLADVLYTQHGIHLSNIIDIQVLHRFLWEIGTLPMRLMQATGLDIGDGETSSSSSLSKSVEIKHSAGETIKSADSISSVVVKSPQHAVNSKLANSTTGKAVCGATCPALDVPLGKLLQYFDIQLSGITVPQSHPLYDACIIDYNNTPPLRSGMWPQFSVTPSAMIHVAASCAVLLDLRILIATQLEVSLAKSMLQLSQGYSHLHLPEFQSAEATHSDALTPLSHDHWMDAPELFSHLSEGHD